MELTGLFRQMVERDASDLFLKIGAPATIRVTGSLVPVDNHELSKADLQGVFDQITTQLVRRRFEERGEADLSYEVPGIGRFRCSIFRQRGHLGMVFRLIRTHIRTFEELNLPVEQLKRLSLLPRGLVLITGTAGSGKSTTLASMIDFINHKEHKHIITIEDPIEFTFTDDLCLIEQRELGVDTDSFAIALKHIVRQSPDVIMIGEMRDVETMKAALNAAETGHLVFSTLHSVNAMQTVERIMTFFPPYQHDFIRLQLSQLLQGVISLRLLPTRDGAMRVPAVELMLATPTISELLLAGKFRELYKAIKEGAYYGTQTFNQSLRKLIEKDLISVEEALRAADSPDELKLELRGISKDTTKYAPAERFRSTRHPFHR